MESPFAAGDVTDRFNALDINGSDAEGSSYPARQNLMIGSHNQARDHTGTCGGDSGGLLFYDDGGVELQVAIASPGDAICRGSVIMARMDGRAADPGLPRLRAGRGHDR